MDHLKMTQLQNYSNVSLPKLADQLNSVLIAAKIPMVTSEELHRFSTLILLKVVLRFMSLLKERHQKSHF